MPKSRKPSSWWAVWGWNPHDTHPRNPKRTPQLIGGAHDKKNAKRLAIEIATGNMPGWYVNVYRDGAAPKTLKLYNESQDVRIFPRPHMRRIADM